MSAKGKKVAKWSAMVRQIVLVEVPLKSAQDWESAIAAAQALKPHDVYTTLHDVCDYESLEVESLYKSLS